MNTSVIDPHANQIASLAQSQYYSRPADQRFETLDTLEAMVASRRGRSIEYTGNTEVIDFAADETGVLVKTAQGDIARPNHYSFGQTAGLIKAPAGFLRDLGAAGYHDLVVQNLNTALALRKKSGFGSEGQVKSLIIDPVSDEGEQTLAAFTSPTYGRIWDADVVAAVRRIVEAHPEFENPKEWGGKRGGLYASDRDVFLFYVDGGSIVDGGRDLLNGGDRDQLHRGFMVWNSEVGSAVFGLAAFLFRMVCGNHMIHGIEGTRLLKIRHTSGGPERFVAEAVPALKEYVNASAKQLEGTVKASKALLLPKEEKEFVTYFVSKGFTKSEIRRAKTFAEQEEGGSHTLWQMQQGFTRSARDVAFIDARTDLERRAGKLLDLVKVDAA